MTQEAMQVQPDELQAAEATATRYSAPGCPRRPSYRYVICATPSRGGMGEPLGWGLGWRFAQAAKVADIAITPLPCAMFMARPDTGLKCTTLQLSASHWPWASFDDRRGVI